MCVSLGDSCQFDGDWGGENERQHLWLLFESRSSSRSASLGFNLPLSKSKFRGAVMGLFGDRRERRDRTLSQSRLGHVDIADA